MPIRPLITLLGLILFSFTLWAAQGYNIVQYNQKTVIGRDGSRSTTYTSEYLVTNESGRITFSNYRVSFQGVPENFRMDEFYSSLGGVKTVTDPKQVRISEVQSDNAGLGPVKLASAPLSNVQVGSLVHIAYTIKTLPSVPGFASDVLQLTTADLGKSESYEYESDSPMQVLPLNTADFFTIEKSTQNQKHFVKIKPTAKAWAQNSKQPATALVYISTFNSWETLNKTIAPEYRKVWQSALPPELDNIVQEARKISVIKDRVEFAARKVHSLIAYSGNWVTSHGQIFPQNFNNLVKTKRGDCKDYSTALAAVLNKLGLQAYPALTWRAEPFHIPENTKSIAQMPSMDLFNHIIVWAKDPATSKTWWVDATNPYINVEITSRDLLSGYALILDEQQKSLSFLPDQNPFAVETTLNQVVKLNGSLMEAQGRLQMNSTSYNEFAQYEALIGDAAAKKFTNYVISAGPNLQITVGKKNQVSPMLTEYEFGYVGPSYLSEDVEKNKWIKFPNFSKDFLRSIKLGQANYIGEIGRFNKITSYEGLQTVDEYESDCSVRTAWVDYDRIVENLNGRIIVTENVKYKKRYLSKTESDISIIRVNLSDFYECANRELITIHINEKSKSDHDRLREAQLGPSVYKMTKADARDLENKAVGAGLAVDRFNKLIKFYNLALKKSPQDSEPYVQKARSFMFMSRIGEEKYDESYLREAVDLLVKAQNLKKEFSQEIYTLLFRAHLNLKNFDLARAYYRALSAETKSAFLDHSLGADLEEARGNYAEAEKHILAFASFKFPDEKNFPFYEPQLARIYFKQKKYDLAEKLYLKFNSFNTQSVNSPSFLAQIYYEQKEYDKVIELDKKQNETKAYWHVPVSVLSNAHYAKILKKYGLMASADGSINSEEFKKIAAAPTLLEKDMADIVQIDSQNTKPLELLVRLNAYLYQTKQQPVFASKVEYYTAMLNKIGGRSASSEAALREVSSVAQESKPSK